MEYSDKYGNSVDEAVRLALEELGLSEDQVMVTVLEEPTKGFLGLGNKLAKVRVEKIEDGEEGPDLSQAKAIAQEKMAEERKSRATHDFRKKNKPQKAQQNFDGAPDYSGKTRMPREGKSEREGRENRKGRGGRAPRKEYKEYREKEYKEYGGREDVNIDIDYSKIESVAVPKGNIVPDPENAAGKFLSDVFSKMGLNVTVESFIADECNYIEVKGDDARVVIGKRGQTVDALQYLTNLVINKGGEEYKRVTIDVEGYRTRREKTLEQLAVRYAKKALATGRIQRLEPMNPYERKVIHATLQQVAGISTKSEGEEPYRRVIIERK